MGLATAIVEKGGESILTAPELHRRTQAFLSAADSTLESSEAAQEALQQTGSASSGQTGRRGRGSRAATMQWQISMDPFTIWRSPPSVSDAEVDAYLRSLSAKDLQRLWAEYELTQQNDFVCLPDGEGDEQRAVHFEPPCSERDTSSTEPAHVEISSPLLDATPAVQVACETKGGEGKNFFMEEERKSAEAMPVTVAPAADFVSSATVTIEPLHFTPRASMQAARFSSTPHISVAADTPEVEATLDPSSADLGPACTVEVEYTSDNWLANSSAGPPLRQSTSTAAKDDLSGDVPAETWGGGTVDSDTEEDDGASDGIQSFLTFSRMTLAKGRKNRADASTDGAVSKKSESRTAAGLLGTTEQPPVPPILQRGIEDLRDLCFKRGPPAPLKTVPRSEPPLLTVPSQQDTVRPTLLKCSVAGRDAFVRTRLRDILLANKVRQGDVSSLTTGYRNKYQEDRKGLEGDVAPALQRLMVMVQEAKTLLQTLEIMEHKALHDMVSNPSEFLCVPRFSAVCASLSCGAPFSATVAKTMCGRCGQFFCLSCCSEQGIGPEIFSGGKAYSLGWEPLCDTCAAICCADQKRIMAQRRSQQLIGYTPSFHGSCAGQHDGAPQVHSTELPSDGAVNLGRMSVREAVLCRPPGDTGRCLEDGLAPFYVMCIGKDETAVFWDVVRYRLAKTQTSLRMRLQDAGKVALNAVSNAATFVNKRAIQRR